MIGEWIDRLISVILPKRALLRAYHRQVFRRVSKRGYQAAETNRLNKLWRTENKSADAELSGNIDKIRARSRDLIRNNAYAVGIVDAIVSNVIGCGIRPQARVESADRVEDEEFNRAAEELFDRWATQADATGRLHFYEIQALLLREIIEAGEALVILTPILHAAREVPLALELIEADRLDSDKDQARADDQNEIRRGIELDQMGRPLGYWILPQPRNDVHTRLVGREASAFFQADRVIHLYRPLRIGQTRGVPWLAPVVQVLRDLSYYTENELQASAVASCFTVAIKTNMAGGLAGLATPEGEDDEDSDGNKLDTIQPGLIARLAPGEDVAAINPGRPNANAQPWIELMLRSIAVSTGLSYELLARDYSKTNFSSNRASSLEDRRRFRPLQEFIIEHFCQRVWRAFLDAAVLAPRPENGRPRPALLPVTLSAYESDPQFWRRVQFQAPGWEWVDPVREEQAAEMAVQAGLSTYAEELAARGQDWRDVFAQRAREEQLATELGLPLTRSSARWQQPPEPDTEVAVEGAAA